MLFFKALFFSFTAFFFLFSQINFPTPKNLIGFREWKNITPAVKIIFPTDIAFDPKKAIIFIKDIPSIEEILISNYPDFRGAQWQPYASRINWLLNDEELNSVYVILKTFNQTRSRHEISAVLHDTIDQKNLDHKIIINPFGYHNWSLNELVFEMEDEKTPNNQGGSLAWQKEVRNYLKINALNIINELPIYANLKIKNLNNSTKLGLIPFLNQHLKTLAINYYENPDRLYLKEKISLAAISEEKSLYGLVKPLEPPITATELYNDKKISRLIIDTRGSFFKPRLFLKVKGEKGETIINPSLFNPQSPAFVRYYKSLEKITRTDNNTLIVNSLKINQENNEIILANRFAKTLLNDIRNLTLIANGNFFILVD